MAASAGLLGAAAGCNEAAGPSAGKGAASMASSGLSGKRSGYDGNVSRWQAFLACWGAGLQRSFDAASTAEPGFVALSVLSKYTVLRAAPQPDGAAMQLQLQEGTGVRKVQGSGLAS